MASAAGINRANALLLSANTGTIPWSVASATTAYAPVGSAMADSGARMVEARNFTKWQFQMLGGGTGYQVTLFGTVDPAVYQAWMYSFNPQSPFGNVTSPASSWFPLYAPADQSSTYSPANPLTSSNPTMQFNGGLVGVRAVFTGSSAALVGSITVACSAEP